MSCAFLKRCSWLKPVLTGGECLYSYRRLKTNSDLPCEQEGMDEATLARFMAKVDRTGECWLWTGGKNRDGYGVMKMDNMKLTHRLSFLYHHGEIPVDCVVRHKCLNKHCVNPNHLEAGTLAENQADRERDGTDARGEKHPASILTQDQVIQIRVLAEIGADRRHKTLADMFDVDRRTITQIINRTRWKHIP